MNSGLDPQYPNGIAAGHENRLRPAFSSPAQVIAFVLLVLSLILMPVLISGSGLITRKDSYELMSSEHGAYAFIGSEIYENDKDIDILFIGSSVQWNAIDTPQVQRAVSEAAGRELRVISFGFNFNGIDIPYTQLRDVLERKRIGMVVFSIPRLPLNDGPNATAYKFLRFDDYPEATDALPFKYKTALYATSVLRSPHDLLTIVRSNRSAPTKFAAELGANKEEMGIPRKPANFVRYTPQPPQIAPEELLFSGSTKDRFKFTNNGLPPYQEHYLKSMIELLSAEGIPLVMINVPQYNERQNSFVLEESNWGERFGRNIPLIGVAPTTLFAGMNEEQIALLHCDAYHFNKNGNEFFTAAIIPAIVDAYQKYSAATH